MLTKISPEEEQQLFAKRLYAAVRQSAVYGQDCQTPEGKMPFIPETFPKSSFMLPDWAQTGPGLGFSIGTFENERRITVTVELVRVRRGDVNPDLDSRGSVVWRYKAMLLSPNEGNGVCTEPVDCKYLASPDEVVSWLGSTLRPFELQAGQKAVQRPDYGCSLVELRVGNGPACGVIAFSDDGKVACYAVTNAQSGLREALDGIFSVRALANTDQPFSLEWINQTLVTELQRLSVQLSIPTTTRAKGFTSTLAIMSAASDWAGPLLKRVGGTSTCVTAGQTGGMSSYYESAGRDLN